MAQRRVEDSPDGELIAGEPLERVGGLEVAAQSGVHPRAVEHDLVAVEVVELLEREAVADEVGGGVLETLLVRGRDRLARVADQLLERLGPSAGKLTEQLPPAAEQRAQWGASASFCSHSAHRSCLFFSQEGQKLLSRQENGHSTLVRHASVSGRRRLNCSIWDRVVPFISAVRSDLPSTLF